MASSQLAPKLHPALFSRLEQARERTDALFAVLPPNSFYSRPIPERHRLIFYLGHLEAFDWNLLSPALDLKSTTPELNQLFAFGIDPVGGGLPTDTPADWPGIAQVERYNQRLRDQLDEALQGSRATRSSDPAIADGTLLQVAIEHRLMHAETLAYLLHNLEPEKKMPHAGTASDPRPSPRQRQVTVPAGVATLGQRRGADFGWDNEFESEQIEVPSFSVDVFPVTNGEYLKFIRAGGYQQARYWKPEDWEWRKRENLEHPHFWIQHSSGNAADPDTQWDYRGMYGAIPLPLSWPVYVSHAEANAFANWAGKKLPTEPQWHRAAYGTAEGKERAYPWSEESPDPTRGNFHHERWDATAVDAHPAGASAWGVQDLLGNGWEWTSSVFGPLRGFQPFPFYPGYSANFFDGKHFVMKGGSARTDACMLRRAFRNWFQPHYSYVYASFRCVEE
jgi:gamma-glutamyl hercynylcysteine S-oxide synthase